MRSSERLEHVFGGDVFDRLLTEELDALARDIAHMCVEIADETGCDPHDEAVEFEAMMTLRSRIGGPKNLVAYCECLVVGEKRRNT